MTYTSPEIIELEKQISVHQALYNSDQSHKPLSQLYNLKHKLYIEKSRVKYLDFKPYCIVVSGDTSDKYFTLISEETYNKIMEIDEEISNIDYIAEVEKIIEADRKAFMDDLFDEDYGDPTFIGAQKYVPENIDAPGWHTMPKKFLFIE